MEHICGHLWHRYSVTVNITKSWWRPSNFWSDDFNLVWRYQRGNQKLYVEKRQTDDQQKKDKKTDRWSTEKGQKDRPMINRKRTKRQTDGQQKKTSNGPQNTTQKTKDLATWHPLRRMWTQKLRNQRSGNMTPTKTDVNSEAQKPKIWQHDTH